MSLSIYLISQTTNQDPRAYTRAVILAVNDDDAKYTHPAGAVPWLGEAREGGRLRQRWKYHEDLWVHPDQVQIDLLGVAAMYQKPGVVIAACDNF